MGRKFEVRKVAMAKTSLQKAKLYSRFGKELYMLAKQGGANPEANLALKHLIDKAKSQQVPNDVIKRNIDKAEKGIGEDFVAIRYEGFGPEGSCFLIDTMTDNVNRTVSEVRHCFTKMGSKLGVKGSVEHQYEHLSLLSVKGVDEETVLDALIEAELDVEDLSLEDDTVLITAGGYDLDKIEEALKPLEGLEIVSSEQGWFPLEKVVVSEENKPLIERFLSMLDELDEVSNVYHNVELGES